MLLGYNPRATTHTCTTKKKIVMRMSRENTKLKHIKQLKPEKAGKVEDNQM